MSLEEENLSDLQKTQPTRYKNTFCLDEGKTIMTALHGPKKAVLVIDGDEAVRSSIVEALETLGFENVVGVGTGIDALWNIARDSQGFPIVVLNIFLPDMTAKAFVDKIPERHGIETLIFLGSSLGGDLAAARMVFERLGISKIRHLKKPGALEQLRELLDWNPPETHLQPD